MEQIHRRGLPMDLVFVPMVESAFEPTAVSPKEAAGLWQIIPATGEERGLLIADGYDGRFDIHASTDAALGYLRDLNKMFAGDWLLALAAYNAGPGTVQEAIKASKAVRPGAEAQSAAGDPEVATVSDPRPQSLYWDLQLPKETQDYVPKILALAQMVAGSPNLWRTTPAHRQSSLFVQGRDAAGRQGFRQPGLYRSSHR
ncbi:MAG: lytic transglycosylase domain-containing protein [Candidatus Competibacteraceae bacterium]